MAHEELVRRKNDHLDILLRAEQPLNSVSEEFSRYRFSHCALPELHLDQISLQTELFGKPLKAPFLISSMTGGALRAATINQHLAEAAERLGIALAVGSQRVALETPANQGLTRELRQFAPTIPILANIGAVQLRDNGLDWARRAVEMIEADALIIHLNPLQEAVQPQGDRDWRGILNAIEEVASKLGVPIVAKEVGAGISASNAKVLVDAGVSVIDVAGSGGTSWALVEAERATTPAEKAIAKAFGNWGIPTPQAIVEVRQALPEIPLIASGGIRDGIDAAKAIRLGADLVGQAAAVLTSALASSEEVIEHFEILSQQLRIACFCTGSSTLLELRQADFFKDGVKIPF